MSAITDAEWQAEHAELDALSEREIAAMEAAQADPDVVHVQQVECYLGELLDYAIWLCERLRKRALERAIPHTEGWHGIEALDEVHRVLDAFSEICFGRSTESAADVGSELDRAIVDARLAAVADRRHEDEDGALFQQASEVEEFPLRRVAGVAVECRLILERVAAGTMPPIQAELEAARQYRWATIELRTLLPDLIEAEDKLAEIFAVFGKVGA